MNEKSADVHYSITHEDITVTVLDLCMGTGAERIYEIRKVFAHPTDEEGHVYLSRAQAIFIRDALIQALA